MSSILYIDFSNIDINNVFVIKLHSQRCCIVKLILIYDFLIWWIWWDFKLSRIHFEYHYDRPDLVVASKLLIILVNNNNNLVDTFTWSWLSLYIMMYYFSNKKHTFLEYDVSLISTRLTLNLFMKDFYFCMVWRIDSQYLLHRLQRYYCASTCKHIMCLISSSMQIR